MRTIWLCTTCRPLVPHPKNILPCSVEAIRRKAAPNIWDNKCVHLLLRSVFAHITKCDIHAPFSYTGLGGTESGSSTVSSYRVKSLKRTLCLGITWVWRVYRYIMQYIASASIFFRLLPSQLSLRTLSSENMELGSFNSGEMKWLTLNSSRQPP